MSLSIRHKIWVLLVMLCSLSGFRAFADDNTIPDRPSPPMLVNDLAGMMNGSQASDLERKLENYANSTSTQVCVVTVNSIGDYDIGDYGVKLFKSWKIGQEGKNNGVLLLIAKNEHRINITV